MNQEWKRQENRDWTYSEGCGCRVTFFADSEYRTLRLTTGEECDMHKSRSQVEARENMIARAKQSLIDYLSIPLQ